MNRELVERARSGSVAWNAWRESKSVADRRERIHLDLTGANLSNTDLTNADLSNADLANADLYNVILRRADLSHSNLSGANLARANLRRADLSRSNLYRADLSGANLTGANLTQADIRSANLQGSILNGTILAAADLSSTIGLRSCIHLGPSIIDYRTLANPIPLEFLRGAGIPDRLIDYLPALLNSPIQFYSCFVSYSSKDQAFAERIQADLQAAGVRCWFAPADLQIGAKIADSIDDAIRLRDKVLLVLSQSALASEWVAKEVAAAFAEESRRGVTVLFPLRLDDAVWTARESWVDIISKNRHIADFRGWRDYDSYRKALSRLIRDLAVNASFESEER